MPAHSFDGNCDAGGSGRHQPVPMARIRSRSFDTWDKGDPPSLQPFLTTQLFPRSQVGIQALVTMVVTPGPGAAAVSGNLTDSGSARVFWGRWHRRVPAAGSASSIRLSLYIYPCLLSRPRVRRFVASLQLGSRCYFHLLPLPASTRQRDWESLRIRATGAPGSLRFQGSGRMEGARC